MVRGGVTARPSNCGEFLRAFATVIQWKHMYRHQGNDLGYGKNAKDWIIRSQVLSAFERKHMDAVQRLDVGRLKYYLFGLKIESDPPEMESKDERSNQPGALEGSRI